MYEVYKFNNYCKKGLYHIRPTVTVYVCMYSELVRHQYVMQMEMEKASFAGIIGAENMCRPI